MTDVKNGEGLRRRTPLGMGFVITLAWTFVALAGPARAQEVNGIYTEPATKDLGTITNIELFKSIKFRGWVEGYYVWNGNKPDRATVNARQAASAIKSRDLTIEGRTFDVHHNSFTAHLAEVELERVPEPGGVGFKVDLAFGDTQDIMVDSIQAVSPQGVSTFDKVFQHASVSYLADVGNGLRFDVGKFVTHIGGETITSIKNRNFSHAFFYTYAIPFQDSGLRVNYTVNSKVYVEGYLLNGWNVTSDNNTGKSVGASLGLTPSGKVSIYANYLGGPEKNDTNEGWRHLGDLQVIFLPMPSLQLMVNVDAATDKDALGPGDDAGWWGTTFYVRPNIGGRFFPTARIEYFKDTDGFATAVAQNLWGFTFTADTKLGADNSFAKLLLRPEIRYDKSSENFFSNKAAFRSRDYQFTVGVGVVAYF